MRLGCVFLQLGFGGGRRMNRRQFLKQEFLPFSEVGVILCPCTTDDVTESRNFFSTTIPIGVLFSATRCRQP